VKFNKNSLSTYHFLVDSERMIGVHGKKEGRKSATTMGKRVGEESIVEG